MWSLIQEVGRLYTSSPKLFLYIIFLDRLPLISSQSGGLTYQKRTIFIFYMSSKYVITKSFKKKCVITKFWYDDIEVRKWKPTTRSESSMNGLWSNIFFYLSLITRLVVQKKNKVKNLMFILKLKRPFHILINKSETKPSRFC